MLRCFFSETIYGEPTAPLFKGLAIQQDAAFYQKHQGQYPVIFLTFKDIKETSFENAYARPVIMH